MGEPGKKIRPAYRFYQYIWLALDWVFPPQCAGCGKIGKRLCTDCDKKIQRLVPPLCPRCGRVQTSNAICLECRQHPPQFVACRSWGIFEGALRECLHHLKYQNDISLGETLARPLIQMLVDIDWKVDVVVPIPLSLDRLKERGYNQASLLARPIALALGLQFRPGALKKKKETPSQVGLTISQRRENVRGVFQSVPEIVAGKKVLLVDDVCTSGATLEAGSESLVEAGAQSVFALTLARAALGHS